MLNLTNSQRKFCEEYVNNGLNGTQAYLKAYKTCKKEETARVNASRLLTNANIQEYVNELQENLKSKAIMSIEERMEWLTNMINGTYKKKSYDGNGNEYENEAYDGDKLKAMDILNKMGGVYVTKIQGDVKVNYEDALKKVSDEDDY